MCCIWIVLISEVVHISNSEFEGVTYFQHSDHYTTPDFEKLGTHPVVYVGKVGHGSYYNPTPPHIGGGCGYFWDYRRPDIILNSWQNLVNLETTEE